MKALVLGHKGMLGHMVVKYLKDNDIIVTTIDLKYPLSSLEIKKYKGEPVEKNKIHRPNISPSSTFNF